MFKGGAVEIEGGKLSFEEQLALAEAAEKARLEAQAAEQKEAEDAWNKYKEEQLVIASAKAASLTASTAPATTAATNAAKLKANWIRTEVANSKGRINENITRLAATIDPDERASMEAEITNELGTLERWVTPQPVNQEALRKANIRFYLSKYDKATQAEAEAWADEQGGK
jgi:hypothetical protein